MTWRQAQPREVDPPVLHQVALKVQQVVTLRRAVNPVCSEKNVADY
jgi:hypothetical protein